MSLNSQRQLKRRRSVEMTATGETQYIEWEMSRAHPLCIDIKDTSKHSGSLAICNGDSTGEQARQKL